MYTITVIDYGMGNLHSMAKALDRVNTGARIQISYDPDEIRRADKIVFPGVGGIAYCMDELDRLGIDEAIREVTREKPTLGVCVGMQAMTQFSEENEGRDALGLFPGRMELFPNGLVDANGKQLKVPHMGWNKVQQVGQHELWKNIPDGERFYFVHSYRLRETEEACVQARTDYPDSFVSAVARDNIFATQFHPEKSHAAGLQLLANFCEWEPK